MSASGSPSRLLDAHSSPGYLAGLIASRRERPTDDILGALIAARDDDDSVITEGELISLCMAILVAGYETTANQLAKFVLCLLDRPDQWQMLLERPDIVPNAVEELMRYIRSMQDRASYLATEDVEVGGVLIRPRRRDRVHRVGQPRQVGVAHADTVDVEQADIFSWASATAHFCLGAPCARRAAGGHQHAARTVPRPAPRRPRRPGAVEERVVGVGPRSTTALFLTTHEE